MNTTIPAGKLSNTHGIRGEFKVQVYLDSGEYLKKFRRILVGDREYALLCVTPVKGGAIIKIEGIDDINDAMALKGREFSVYRQDAPLPKGKFFLQDMFGARAIDQSGEEIGIVKDVIENPAHPIFVIKGKTEHLVPAVPEYILEADVENQILKINMIEGL